jgi:hypothetical protein
MTINISKCEIDKENQLSTYFDLIILGHDNLVFNSVINHLSTFGQHATKPSIGFCFVGELNDINQIINNCVLNNSKVILIHKNIGGNLHFDEICTFSNNLMSSPDILVNVTNHFIGFQRHLASLDRIIEIESNGCFAASLGLITSDILNIEPDLRVAKNLFVDLNICKKSYFQNILDAAPTGLDPESLIQSIRFAAHSPLLNTIIFNINNFDLTTSCDQESTMIAECIWYVIEGISIGQFEIGIGEKTFVSLKDHDLDVEFSYSVDSNKYWVRIYDENELEEFIPCSKSEFLECTQEGLISSRLAIKFSKYF